MFISHIEKVSPSSISAPIQFRKWGSFGNVNISQSSIDTFKIRLSNIGPSEIRVFSYTKLQIVNGFYTANREELSSEQQSKSWGFVYYILSQFDEKNPLILKPGTPDRPTTVDFATIEYTGAGLFTEELYKDYGVVFEFETDDLGQSFNYLETQLQNNQVVLEARPTDNKWQPSAKITFTKNIHGHLNTPKLKDIDFWKLYAKRRIDQTLPGVERISISDFLEQKDFLNNKKFDDDLPEPKRVLNRFEDPLPPYDFIWPYGDNYVYNGLRRTHDYFVNPAPSNRYVGRRIAEYYSNLFDEKQKNRNLFHQFWINKNDDVDPRILVLSSDKTSYTVRQRREWGFREKVLQGFPYYIPKYVQTKLSANNSNQSLISPGRGGRNTECGQGPIIAGFVTAGSGIFSGISPAVEIKYDYLESQRTIKAAGDTAYGTPRVPTGLIFIQDETGAIGFSIGTDMRYMDSPFHHTSVFSNPSVGDDRMHLGSYGLPKPDYRQFLREGDLVIIQVGVGFKYWHPVLGAEPKHWEGLRGKGEIANAGVFEKIQYPEEIVEVGDVNPNDFQCSCPKEEDTWKSIGEFDSLDFHQSTGPSPTYTTFPLPAGKIILNSTLNRTSPNQIGRVIGYRGQRCADNTITNIRLAYRDKNNTSNTELLQNIVDISLGINGKQKAPTFLKIEGPKYTYEFEILSNNINDILLDDEELHSYIPLRIRAYYPATSGTAQDCGKTFKVYTYSPPTRKNCISVREFMDAENTRGKTPPYPCEGMTSGEQKIVTFTSPQFGKKSFFFTLDQTGRCICRKLSSDGNIAGDYIWPEPPTKNFVNVKPYIDNWGGYTYPETSQAKEAAINVPLPLLSESPDIFDATHPRNESLIDWMANIIREAVFSANVGSDIAGIVTGILKDPTVTTRPDFYIVTGIFLVVQLGTIVVIKNIYVRNKHILPSRIPRDSQFPYTDFHPIQQEHPWSTGTPIPVNSGMQYIMADVFSVDNRERFAPPPLEITAAQLRGIPIDTWKYDPSDEWRIPHEHQKNIEQISGKILIRKDNQYQEFPDSPFVTDRGTEIPQPKTPFTLDPGSKYKGQLVKIKNVRFIDPPQRFYYAPKVANQTDVQNFKDEYYSVMDRLKEFMQNPGNKIEDFKVSIQLFPYGSNSKQSGFELLNAQQISNDLIAFLDVLEPMLELAQTVVNIFSIFDRNVSMYINVFVDKLQTVIRQVVIAANKVSSIGDTREISGFSNEFEIARFLGIKNGIDFTGFNMNVNYDRELHSFLFKDLNSIDLEKLIADFTNAALQGIANGNDENAANIAKGILQINSAWNEYYIPERKEIHESFAGPIEPALEYEQIFVTSQFPWTVDAKDGGYWWTHPDIPLTNARSHQNDANYGNPLNWGDNDHGVHLPNRDGNFLFLSNPFTSRRVFTQLVSSNKTNVYIPTYVEPGDDSFDEEHEYSMSYIKDRYVKDLGPEYAASYEPFAEEWKPYRYDGGVETTKTTFSRIRSGDRFYGDRVYYVVDEDNVVIPIRINANTEIARYSPYVPTGSIDLVGIAWQYSGGKPGMEWERERYIMQVWPRYLSDVGLKWTPETRVPLTPDGPIDPDVPVTPPPPPGPPPPRRLPDVTLEIEDNPARLDCETLRDLLNLRNKEKEDTLRSLSWPIIGQDMFGNNIHEDPTSGRRITFGQNAREVINALPDYPCKGMNPGDQQYVTVASIDPRSSVRRTFFFTVGPDGECLCSMLQPGSETSGGSANNRGGDQFGGRQSGGDNRFGGDFLG